MKRKLQLAALLLAFSLLAGCSFKTGDELLRAPKPPKGFEALQTELDKAFTGDTVYAAPERGENRTTVQFKDLDNDGEDEVIAFFRESPNSSKFFINVYKKLGEKYQKMGSVQGTGTSILSVEYPVLTSDGKCGIVVAWQINAGESTTGLTVCSFENGTLQTALETDYIDFEMLDLLGDGKRELVTLNTDPTGKKFARMYKYQAGKMELAGEAALAADAKTIMRMTAGYTAGKKRAVFVEAKNDSGVGLMTDIFLCDDGGFRNIAPENGQNEAYSTYRPVSVYAMDINGDGVTEVPRVSLMAGFESGSADALYLFDWYIYGGQQPALACTTYNSQTEEWKLMVPDAWHDTVTVSRTSSFYGMNCTTFEAYNSSGPNIPLLNIYYLTGNAMRTFSESENMVELARTNTAIYAMSIPQEAASSALALTVERVQQRFSLISQYWDQ